RDEFDAVSYSNNDGSANWNGAWIENDAGGASAGRIFVAAGQLNVQANTAGAWIYRSANLNGSTSATLSFDFNNTLQGADSIALQVSKDGGANYTTLAGGTFSSGLNTGSGSRTFDITSYAAADTRIRFLVNGVGNKKTLFIDNVQIAYSDLNTGFETPFSTASDTASIAVTGVNDPPVVSVPASQTANEDASLVFSTANGNAVTVSDVDAGTAPVQLTVSVTHGALTLTPKIGSEFQVNTTTASDQQAPRIAVGPDGHYVVVWQS